MPRARFIRPEFFTDEKVGDLPIAARLLFAGIWCHCDMRGVFEASPKLLRARLFPFDETVTGAQVGDWLALLEAGGMIGRFESGGKTWGYVRNWAKHQTISTREREIDKNLRPETRWPSPPQTEDGAGTHPGMSEDGSGDATPSPSPSPAPAPAPAPSPGDARTNPATAAARNRRISALNPDEIVQAVRAGDPMAIVAAFRGNTAPDRRADWLREADELLPGQLAAILFHGYDQRAPIREPSGLRPLRAKYDAGTDALRTEWAASLRAFVRAQAAPPESAPPATTSSKGAA